MVSMYVCLPACLSVCTYVCTYVVYLLVITIIVVQAGGKGRRMDDNDDSSLHILNILILILILGIVPAPIINGVSRKFYWFHGPI